MSGTKCFPQCQKKQCNFDHEYIEGSVDSIDNMGAIGCPNSAGQCDNSEPPKAGCWYMYNNPADEWVPTDHDYCPQNYQALPMKWSDALSNGATSYCNCIYGTYPIMQNWLCIVPKLCAPVCPGTENLDTTTKINCCTNNVQDPIKDKCGCGWCADGDPCGEFMTNYCTQNGYNEACVSYLSNTTNQSAKKEVIQGILSNLYPNQANITSKTAASNEKAVELCSLQPGACDSFLKERCAWVNDVSDIEDDDKVLELCGCFLNQNIYNKDYANLAKPPLPIECTPPCTYPTAITPGVPDATGEGEHFANCKRHICVMDDVTINIINSTVKGDIDFQLLCGGMPDASTCYFSDIAVNNIDSKLDGQVKFETSCNNSCYIFDHSNPIDTTRIDCKTFKKYGNRSTCNKQCKDDDDCPDGYCPLCSISSGAKQGECRSRPYSQNCQSKLDCQAGENCVSGKCIKACVQNEDCPKGFDCVGGDCLFPCKDDKACEEGMSCVNGYCQPGGGGNGNGGNIKQFWDKYKWYIIGGGAGLLVLIMIILLIHHHRRRKRRLEK